MKKILGIAAVVIIAIAIGFFLGNKETKLGSVVSLSDVTQPFVKINGFETWSESKGLAATSSVICAIKNPFVATSTIVSLGAQSRSNGIAVANALYISTSTTAYGTSTPALVSAFAMGTGQWSVELEKNSATTTASDGSGATTNDTTLLPGRASNGASRYVLGPSEWVTWTIATSTAGTFSSYNVGQCTAQFKKF